MHTKVLSRWLDDRSVIGHSTRSTALVRVVRALLTGCKLSLTHLGRSLRGSAQVKHEIKAVDRLLGNRHLQHERDGVYRAIARTLLSGIKRPVVIVDWSDFELGRQWLMLKAAVPVGGRAISLYERVFPFKRYNSPGAHREFLRALHSILPEGCRPIIVTDAGFRGPWFRAVEAYGWDWVGRIRNKIKYYREQTARCRTAGRLEILLLLGALATLVAWLVGLAGRALNWHRHLQANTERKREVLSTFFIGRELLRHDECLPAHLLTNALRALGDLVSLALPA